MSRLGLKVNGITKYLDDGNAQVLAETNGERPLSLRQTGPFIYVTGRGNTDTPTRSVAVSKLVPPASKKYDRYVASGYACGVVDAFNIGAIGRLAVEPSSDTITTTGSGTFKNWDIASTDGARPFMVGLLGDSSTSKECLQLKINGVTKKLIPSAEDNAGSLFRYVKRYNPTLEGDFNGSLTCSSWGSVVVMNIEHLSGTVVGNNVDTTVTTLPAEIRPPVDVSFVFGCENNATTAAVFFRAVVKTNGKVILSRPGNSAFINWSGCGGGIWSTTIADNAPLFNKIGLKINGVRKTVLELNNENLTTQHKSFSATLVGGSGTLHVWKIGNFVFGNACDYKFGKPTLGDDSGWLNGPGNYAVPFQITSQEYIHTTGTAITTFGAGYQRHSATEGDIRPRIAYRFDNDAGTILAWSKDASSTDCCGLSFYYYCNR